MNRNLIVQSGIAAIASIAALVGGHTAARAQVSDPANDFLASYQGPQNGDLDVTSANATFDGTNFLLTATFNAPVGTTTGAFYVWGVDRGAGTQGFPTIAPGVTFDSVILLRPGGASTANGNALSASNISFTGNTLTALVPASFLPSTGKPFSQYMFNLWPRFSGTFNGVTPTGNATISDFAPNNSDITVTVVPAAAPEPSSFALLFGALAPVGAVVLRRRSRRSAA